MKKILTVTLALSLTLGLASPIPLINQPTKVEAATHDYEQTSKQVLNYLNNLRKNMGLSEITYNPMIAKAADAHANYLNLNGLSRDNYTEEKGKVGFVGETLADRIRATGGTVDKSYYETLFYSSSDLITAIEKLINNYPFERMSLLSEGLKEMGVARQGGYMIMVEQSSSDDYHTYPARMYPYDGQTGVNVAYAGESFSEISEDMNDIKGLGYAITYDLPNRLSFDVKTNSSLKDSRGNTVPIVIMDGFGSLFIFAKDPLNYGETYTVEVNYEDMITGEKGGNTWSFTTVARDRTPLQQIYADIKGDEYWLQDMSWAIDLGLISGYKDVLNPKTRESENFLKPYSNLTEAQFLKILLTYTNQEELSSLSPSDTNLWTSTLYQMAEKYYLPTNSTLANQSYANKPITRGKMAQILASKHFGKTVSVKEAVQFMYNAGLSNGYPDKNGNSPKTYESYGVDKLLLRVHIATFMKNYDTYLRSLD